MHRMLPRGQIDKKLHGIHRTGPCQGDPVQLDVPLAIAAGRGGYAAGCEIVAADSTNPDAGFPPESAAALADRFDPEKTIA